MKKRGKVGIGVIGCGSISWLCHFPSIKAISELELVAVCDSNEEYARKAAEKWGAKKWYTDYRKMVENKDLNAVIIASANSVHYEQTIAAAQAGLHVYVEKPMAVTNKEAWEMVRICRENKVKLTVGTNQRFWFEHEWAKKLIEDGVIGEVKFGRSSLHETWHLYQDNVAYSDYRLKPEGAASATLFDQGSHRVDLLRWLMGSEAKRVVGVAKRVATPEDVCPLDNLSWVAIDFENGAQGIVTTDKFSPVVSNITEIYGTEGMMFMSSEATNPFQSVPLAIYTAKDYTWDNLPEIIKKYRYPTDFWVTDLITKPLPKRWISITPPREWSFTRMMRHFLTCFVEDKDPLVTGEDGAKVMEILCGVFKSMQTSAWVDLPLKEEVIPPHYKKQIFYICPINYEVSLETIRHIHSLDKMVAMDLGGWGGAASTTHPKGEKDYHILRKLMKYLHVVKASTEDCRYIFHSKDIPADEVPHLFVEWGAKIGIVTLGKNGSVVANKKRQFRVPAFSSHVIDCTGAGDVYSAGFLAEYLKIKNVVKSALFASATASLVIEDSGGVSAKRLPTRAEVLKRIRTMKNRYSV